MSELKAAPHTRGSTPMRLRRASSQSGCPAHAGIDPRESAARRLYRGLPRTRGDRPPVLGAAITEATAAPHTRGSTHRSAGSKRLPNGCPAHAGIDPGPRRTSRSPLRLPRTRGDRPIDGCRVACEGGAAPHTRGSTRQRPTARPSQLGCPAHAGIDPSCASIPRTIHRLPRTRGDRPSRARCASVSRWAAPHTRGSTLCALARVRADRGCPAHAGIDPSSPRTGGSSRGLPRTRGDRPYACEASGGPELAAPHTRGSTPKTRKRRPPMGGCPAHAGIDPLTGDPFSPGRWLPRTRGDRPSCCPEARASMAAAPHTRGSTLAVTLARRARRGCPAHAGIDPSATTVSGSVVGLPRTRGDRPVALLHLHFARVAAPHTRGSTRACPPSPVTSTGCPAHAGIDPTRSRTHRQAFGLPRTRGDRPVCFCWRPLPSGAAPHTRGSTLTQDHRDQGNAGCPAHAGIDLRTACSCETRGWLPRTRGDRPT